jgi:hypothetical protein
MNRALTWLFGAAVLFAFIQPLANNDVWFHLRIGQAIVETGHLPDGDVYSHTAPGAAYVDQEWLTQVLFYGIQASPLGLDGIAVLCAAAAAGTFLLLLRVMPGPFLLNLAILLLSAPLAQSHFHARPHVLGWLLIAVLLNVQARGPAWRIPMLLALWANLHASFALGVALAALRFLERKQWAWLAASLLAPLLNPYGWRLYGFLFMLKDLPLDMIREFEPYAPLTGYFWVWTTYTGALLAGLALRFRKEGRFPLWEALPAAGLGILGFTGARYAPVAAFCLAPLQSKLWAPCLPSLTGGLGRAIAAGLASVTVTLATLMACLDGAGRLGIDAQRLPVGATDFLLRSPLEGPLYNFYDYGGYLIWKAWPRFPVFVDGRIDVYHGAPLADYRAISRAEPGWEEIARRREIRCFLVGLEHTIAPTLAFHPDWEPVYFDHNALVFVRKGDWPELPRIGITVQRLFYTLHRQRDRADRMDKDQAGEQVEELQRFLAGNDGVYIAHKRLAFLYYRQGNLEGARTEMARYLALFPKGGGYEESREMRYRLGMGR